MSDDLSPPITRVGHCKRDSIDVYVGRGRNGRHMLSTETGEYGWLGNPFPTSEMTREESIHRFHSVFLERLHEDEEFREAVRELHGKVLGCWCRSVEEDEPACHADVISNVVDKMHIPMDADEPTLTFKSASEILGEQTGRPVEEFEPPEDLEVPSIEEVL